MPTAVTTTVTELPESRVSVDVEVAADEIQRSLESQARKLGREMKVPGFRTGKIPPAIVIQRIGREPILDEAVRGRLTDWYMKAVDESGIAPVGDPEVDLGDAARRGQAADVLLRGRRAPERDARRVPRPRRCPSASRPPIPRPSTTRSTRCASASSRLETVDRPGRERRLRDARLRRHDRRRAVRGRRGPRPARRGRRGPPHPGLRGGARRRQRRRDEDRRRDVPRRLRRQARRRQAGPVRSSPSRRSSTRTSRSSTTTSPPTPRATTRSRSCASRSPRSCSSTTRSRVEAEFRDGALDAVVGEATVDVPEPLVNARAKELLDRMIHSLGHQGISKAGLPADLRQDRGRADRGVKARRRAGAAPRGRARRGHRGRADRADRGAAARRPRGAPRRASRPRARSCSTACARPVGSTSLVKEVAAEQAIDLVVTTAVPVAPEEAEAKPAKAAKKPAAKKAAAKKPAAKKKAPAKEPPGAKRGELWTPEHGRGEEARTSSGRRIA